MLVPDLSLTVHTLASVYGPKAGETVLDEVWLADAGKFSWVILTADQELTHVEIEREALKAARARVFRLPRCRRRLNTEHFSPVEN